MPAQVQIGGQPCNIVNFYMTNMPDTSFACKNLPQANTAQTEFFGNRGINLIVDNVYTPYSNLATASPSPNAVSNVTNQVAFSATGPVTVWLKGFISPQKDSNYQFILQTNGAAVLYLSTDATSVNKV